MQLLGRYEITVAGKAVSTGLGSKAREALAYLAVHPEGATAREMVCDLWLDEPVDNRSLHNALGRARQALRKATGTDTSVEFLPRHDDCYRINAALVATDLAELRRSLETATRARGHGDSVAEYAATEEAVKRYRGSLLEKEAYPWAEAERQYLLHVFLGSLYRAVEFSPNNEKRLLLLEKAIEVDPFNEDHYHHAMAVQAEIGDRGAAARTYRLLCGRLRRELETEPGPATTALYRAVQASQAQPPVGPPERSATE